MRGKGNRADQFCIYRTSDGRNIPALAIEYKAPYKLGRNEVITGLVSEIRPERDVINKSEEGFAFVSKALAVAVVTQLFSYMIGKGIRYGYVCIGEAFVFLYIPDDPTSVYYYVLRAKPPPTSWYDAAAALNTWAVEYDDILRNIPESVLKEARNSPYKPPRWQGFKRSPIRNRSRCKQLDTNASGRDESDDDEEDTQRSPIPNRSYKKDVTRSTGLDLARLAYGTPMDKACPNYQDHGHQHIKQEQFLHLVRTQLAQDRGRDADAVPLYLSGRIGVLFKVLLSSHGYTLVAKGVEPVDLGRL
ncbi:hypothetical protein CSOJ01_15749 [Colletotrichum sojae]|uniref:Uncharacterized protein n=1 Tax=Colletotrichum sojae TaxID=2175907 RepID=A0A8H6MI68_9PEZI|nr:hypothetical protein CSOJ01_15749 [Colletotrichum sojae]